MLTIQTSNMKRPGVYLAALFFTTICSTALVAVLITGIAKVAQKHDKGTESAKSVQADQSARALSDATGAY